MTVKNGSIFSRLGHSRVSFIGWVGFGSFLGLVRNYFLKSLDQSLTRVEGIGIDSSNNNSGDEFHFFYFLKTVCYYNISW